MSIEDIESAFFHWTMMRKKLRRYFEEEMRKALYDMKARKRSEKEEESMKSARDFRGES
jgi:hypothetical protein